MNYSRCIFAQISKCGISSCTISTEPPRFLPREPLGKASHASGGQLFQQDFRLIPCTRWLRDTADAHEMQWATQWLVFHYRPLCDWSDGPSPLRIRCAVHNLRGWMGQATEALEAVRAVHLIMHIARLVAPAARVRPGGAAKRGCVQKDRLGETQGACKCELRSLDTCVACTN